MTGDQSRHACGVRITCDGFRGEETANIGNLLPAES